MNILFIGYWGINEGLSVATIDPHLEILSQFPKVEKVVFASIERKQETLRELNISRIQHVPYYSGTTLADKLRDYTKLPRYLVALCSQHQIDIIICRGAPAGALGYLVWKKTRVPFCVESFETHADYMLESGVWSRLSPHYLLSKYWEEKQKECATLLIPVANNHLRQLAKEGIKESRIKMVPCTVDLHKFEFSAKHRNRIRKELKICKNTVVGIYVGKYGGIYMDEEAFKLYKNAFRYWQDFFLVILSPREHHEHIFQRIKAFSLPEQNIFVKEVQYQKVPMYLSTADFAFATYTPGKFKAFLSPIKVGEYWANGPPVALTEGVGDDTEITVREQTGVLINKDRTNQFAIDYNIIQQIFKDKSSRLRIQAVARKYRNRDAVKEAYSYLLG